MVLAVGMMTRTISFPKILWYEDHMLSGQAYRG